MKVRKTTTVLCAIGLLFAMIGITQATVIKIDVHNQAAAPGSEWNTVTTASSYALDDIYGNPTGISVGIAGSFVKTSGDAAATGQFAVSAPHLAAGAADYFYIYSPNTGTFTFSGLDDNKKYAFHVVSSRSSGSRRCDITVGGSFADTTPNGDDFNPVTDGYTNGRLLVWDQVAPSGGQIPLAVQGVSGMVGYLNAIQLTESVLYRELFPNSTGGNEQNRATEGWDVHYGTGGTSVPSADAYYPAYDGQLTLLPPVKSNPNDLGGHWSTTKGYLYNRRASTDGTIYWTDEFSTITVPGEGAMGLVTDGLDTISFTTRDAGPGGDQDPGYIYRLALRVDDGGSEDWYVSTTTVSQPDDGVLEHQLLMFDLDTTDWTDLTFVPGSQLLKGTNPATLPAGALVTAFGLYQDILPSGGSVRIDSFTITGQMTAVPEPAALTLLGLGAFLLLPLARRRRDH